MSENNNQAIITEAEILPAEPYDFEFITFAMGMIQICNGNAGINVANIASIERAEEGDDWILTMINDQEYTLTPDDMANLDRHLRDRKAKRKDVIKDEYVAQNQAQVELSGGVQPGRIVGAQPRKSWRPQ